MSFTLMRGPFSSDSSPEALNMSAKSVSTKYSKSRSTVPAIRSIDRGGRRLARDVPKVVRRRRAAVKSARRVRGAAKS
jgi:hypothetical protein